MHRIGQHGSTVAQYTGSEFKYQQHEINQTAPKRDAENAAFALLRMRG